MLEFLGNEKDNLQKIQIVVRSSKLFHQLIFGLNFLASSSVKRRFSDIFEEHHQDQMLALPQNHGL